MREAPRSSDGLTRVHGLFGRLLDQRGGAGAVAVARLECVWTEVVGEALARQCRPLSLSQGKLVIGVPSPTWNATLRTMERQILANLQRVCPELGIQTLRLVLGARRTEEAQPSPAALRDQDIRAIELSAAELRDIDETVAPLADEALRERVAQMMVRQKQVRQWRLAHGWTIDPATGRTLPPR